jgi:hypothetical protein
MIMKYATEAIHHRLHVHVDLEDVPDMTRKHGSTTVAPVRARIDATNGHIDRITVFVQRRLKSGALGEDVWGDSWSVDSSWDKKGRPAWLDDLVRQVMAETITPSWLAHQAELGVSA